MKSKMARRLKSIAQHINLTWSSYTAEIVEGYCNTDRKIPGSRLRHVGMGRTGNRLIVRDTRTGKIVFDHNAAETYRTNAEVEAWVRKMEADFG